MILYQRDVVLIATVHAKQFRNPAIICIEQKGLVFFLDFSLFSYLQVWETAHRMTSLQKIQ